MTELPPPPPISLRRVVWVALPNGVLSRTSEARLSVLVSPRLHQAGEVDGTLALHPDLDPWPGKRIEFTVEIAGQPVEARLADEHAADADLWRAILPSTTLVRSHRPVSFADRPIHSYSASMLNGWLKDVYGAVGASEELPDLGELNTRFGPADLQHEEFGESRESIEARLGEVLDTRRAIVEADLDTIRDNLVLVDRFHRPKGSQVGATSLPRRPEVPVLDFHQILSLLAEHPIVLRKLGLIIDLVVPLGGRLPAEGPVRVRPTWEPEDAGEDVCPKTWTDLGRFRPAPLDGAAPYLPGNLAVGREGGFEVVNVDLDGCAIKTMSYARELLTRPDPGGNAARFRRPAVPPAIRSAGMQLVRRDRALALHEQWRTADEVAAALAGAGDETLLGAEHVTRGLRPDVEADDTGQWHSLVERVVDYHFADPSTPPIEGVRGEGTVTTAVAGAEGEPEAGFWLGESVFQWTGWSLAAPRPGKAISKAEFPGDAGYEDRDIFEGDPPVATVSKAKPGSLPMLRFGTNYRMRARTVDLAGNSLPVDAPVLADEEVVDAGPYLRFEPIEDPELVTNAPRTPAEQIDTLVVRTSDFDEEGENTPESLRFLYPPKTAQLLAEQHGMFDVHGPVALDIEAYAEIASRESNTFGLRMVDGALEPYGTPDPMAPGARYHPDPPPVAPYLPDPLAKAVAFRGLATAGEVDRVELVGSWPDVEPIVFHLGKGNDEPAIGPGRVGVSLPPGLRRTVHISSAPAHRDVNELGQYQWAVAQPEADAEAIRQRIIEGRAPLVTPARRIELVHAVRQPPAPLLDRFSAPRNAPGATFAVLTGAVTFLRPATGRLDILASWTDPVDERRQAPPPGGATAIAGIAPASRTVRRAVAASIPVDRPIDPRLEAVSVLDPHEFGDTKHHLVTYEPMATSAYTEFFTRTGSFAFSAQGTITLPDLGQGIVEGSVRVRSEDRKRSFTEGDDFTVSTGGTGTPATVTRTSGGALAGVDAVEVSWLANPISRIRGAVEVHVPSSARPSAPVVSHVVPTFGWERTSTARQTVSRRRGNGLRIFLERPWWGSGRDELLGVVLHRATTAQPEPPTELANLTTQWGIDPTVVAGDVHATPRRSHFPRVAPNGTGIGLALVEAQGTGVDVVGHEVRYDEGRDLYTCDIEIDAGAAYLPFVRLALCRYQPYSINGLHLSPVVLADFIQLAPDRTATITAPARGRVATVSLTGPMYSRRGQGVNGPGFARVIVERQQFPEAGDAGWTEVRRVELSGVVSPASSPNATWQGSISMPVSSDPLRLVIEQGERIPTSGSIALLPAVTEYGERLVHQDVVPYPPVPT